MTSAAKHPAWKQGRATGKKILILADIEGSSGCWSYKASAFMTRPWARACKAMSLDINAVASALLEAGAARVTVKDFHRTGFNLLAEYINPKVHLVSGYRAAPVPGIGDPSGHDILMMVGLHAASGTRGFLAHTLTSRIASLKINNRQLTEAELFAGALAPWGLRPVFFSGDPAACAQATDAIPGIQTYDIDKLRGPRAFDADAWRGGLSLAAVHSLQASTAKAPRTQKPVDVKMTMRDGTGAARKLASRWHLEQRGPHLWIRAEDLPDLYSRLVRICYLSPYAARVIPLSLFVFNLRGRIGLQWVRWYLRRQH